MPCNGCNDHAPELSCRLRQKLNNTGMTRNKVMNTANGSSPSHPMSFVRDTPRLVRCRLEGASPVAFIMIIAPLHSASHDALFEIGDLTAPVLDHQLRHLVTLLDIRKADPFKRVGIRQSGFSLLGQSTDLLHLLEARRDSAMFSINIGTIIAQQPLKPQPCSVWMRGIHQRGLSIIIAKYTIRRHIDRKLDAGLLNFVTDTVEIIIPIKHHSSLRRASRFLSANCVVVPQ